MHERQWLPEHPRVWFQSCPPKLDSTTESSLCYDGRVNPYEVLRAAPGTKQDLNKDSL